MPSRRNLRAGARLADATPCRARRRAGWRRRLRRRACGHVARVLLRRVGEDELATSGREVAIRDVNRDACSRSARRPSVKREKSDGSSRAILWMRAGWKQLIFVDRARNREQPPDQRNFPIVHRSQPQMRRSPDIRNTPRACGLPLRFQRHGRRARVAPRSVMRLVATSSMILSSVSAPDSPQRPYRSCRQPCGSAPLSGRRWSHHPGVEDGRDRHYHPVAPEDLSLVRSRWTAAPPVRARCIARCRPRSNWTKRNTRNVLSLADDGR